MFAPSEPIHSVLSFPLLPGKPKSDHLISYSNEKVIYVSCWTYSHPTLSSLSLLSSPSTTQLLFTHCSCCSLVGFPHAWPAPLPPKLSSLVAFLLLTFFFFCLTTQPPRCLSPVLIPVFHITQVTHLLYRRTAQPLVATRGFFSFFSNTLFFLSPFLTIHPSSGLLLEKIWYMSFKKKWKEGRKNPYSLFKPIL